MLKLLIIFLWFFQLSMQAAGNYCRHPACANKTKLQEQSPLNHAFVIHGSFVKQCRFCPQYFGNSNVLTQNRQHIKDSHPELGLGFLLYNTNLPDERVKEMIRRRWSEEFFIRVYQKNGRENKLLKTRLTCLMCNESELAVSALFHAAHKHWLKDGCLQCCNTKFISGHNRKGLGYNYIAAIEHVRTCKPDLKLLDVLMQKTFPEITVLWENNNLTINFRDSKKIEGFGQNIPDSKPKRQKISKDDILPEEELVPHWTPALEDEMPTLPDFLSYSDFETPRTYIENPGEGIWPLPLRPSSTAHYGSKEDEVVMDDSEIDIQQYLEQRNIKNATPKRNLKRKSNTMGLLYS